MTRWRFLTRAYVEALALPKVPVMTRRQIGFITPALGGAVETTVRIERGVAFGGALYVEEGDGLAFKRAER